MGQGKKPATYEDIEALPPGWVGEIVDGELMAAPRPARPHARVASLLGARLTMLFDFGEGGPGGWWILDEPELHLGRQVLVPDLAGWRREREPWLVDRQKPFFTLPPDWVCEVLSSSTASFDRHRKLPVYHQQGVSNVWLIEPVERTLEVYRRGEQRWQLCSRHGGDEIVRAEPFDAVPLDLRSLWS